MSKKVIIFNGPPNSGKDALGAKLAQLLDAPILRFKDGLYKETAHYLGESPMNFIAIASDRVAKEKNFRWTNGEVMTPREALIHVSEEVIKPERGADYLGKLLANRLVDGWNVVTDGGFEEEAAAVAKAADELHIVGLYCDGCSFEGDSRRYLPLWMEGVDSVIRFDNNKHLGLVNSTARLINCLLKYDII